MSWLLPPPGPVELGITGRTRKLEMEAMKVKWLAHDHVAELGMNRGLQARGPALLS